MVKKEKCIPLDSIDEHVLFAALWNYRIAVRNDKTGTYGKGEKRRTIPRINRLMKTFK